MTETAETGVTETAMAGVTEIAVTAETFHRDLPNQ